MKYALRMTEAQHGSLRAHLFPGDGLEAAALLLCGRARGPRRHIFTVRRVLAIPYSLCERRADSVTWPTQFVDELLQEGYGRGQSIVKVHSHPAGYRRFSSIDDESDQALYAAITSLLNDGLPHASLIMLPDGFLFGRVVGDEGQIGTGLESVMAVGHDLKIWHQKGHSQPHALLQRQAQAFGRGTVERLRVLSVAVIGCSGTGSVVIEQLARLGVGRLVLVDPDVVEEKNLNRILNSGKEDAYLARPKPQVLASAIARMGLGQEVSPICANLISAATVSSVAECDIVFGCMDGAEPRRQ